MAKQVPQHPDGFKYAGAAGTFRVWHAGKNDYRVTNLGGNEINRLEQFGLAHAYARRMEAIERCA